MKASVCGRQNGLGRLNVLLFALLALFLFPGVISTSAQSTGGRIRGTVTDPSGGAITGAKVTLTNEATNIAREVQTGTNGEYLFLEVPVGSYEIDVTQQSFKKYVHKGLALDLNAVVAWMSCCSSALPRKQSKLPAHRRLWTPRRRSWAQ